MKKPLTSKRREDQEMAPEYRFDYKKAKPNRFAEKMKLDTVWVVAFLTYTLIPSNSIVNLLAELS